MTLGKSGFRQGWKEILQGKVLADRLCGLLQGSLHQGQATLGLLAQQLFAFAAFP
jgi:hypothetical protein